MNNKYTVILSLLICGLLCSCDDDLIDGYGEPFDPLYPLKDDKTTVGNFESSKFDGIWQATNHNSNYYYSTLFIFKKNTFQIFEGRGERTEDYDEVLQYKVNQAVEFMYSDTAIYSIAFYNYKTWDKIDYKLSPNGNNLIYGRNSISQWKILEKMDVTPWTKDDLIGFWHEEYPGTNNIYLYIFTDDSLVIQIHTNGILKDTRWNYSITLTDESFTTISYSDGDMVRNYEKTAYYYIIEGSLFLSNDMELNDSGRGIVLSRYVI